MTQHSAYIKAAAAAGKEEEEQEESGGRAAGQRRGGFSGGFSGKLGDTDCVLGPGNVSEAVAGAAVILLREHGSAAVPLVDKYEVQYRELGGLSATLDSVRRGPNLISKSEWRTEGYSKKSFGPVGQRWRQRAAFIKNKSKTQRPRNLIECELFVFSQQPLDNRHIDVHVVYRHTHRNDFVLYLSISSSSRVH